VCVCGVCGDCRVPGGPWQEVASLKGPVQVGRSAIPLWGHEQGPPVGLGLGWGSTVPVGFMMDLWGSQGAPVLQRQSAFLVGCERVGPGVGFGGSFVWVGFGVHV
jgi:hypothetical protein